MTYDMEHRNSIAVEATSLSAITDIASNPPSNPQASRPTNTPNLPLTLYIARVPGSRDVFLTPMKPRDKTVTAEDVHSSLYYVHVNNDEVEQPPAPPSSVNTDASYLRPIQEQGIRRKPTLPARRPVSTSSSSYPITNGTANVQNGTVARKPFGPISNQPQHMDLPILPPRPLPAPPIDEQPYEESLHARNMRLLRHADHSDENNPYLQVYEPSPPSIDLPEPGSLTLIRRDPYLGDQWNVASMHDPPMKEVSSAALRNPTAAQRAKRGGAPLYLDISNPGYMQFVNPARTQSRQSSDSTSSSSSDPPPDGIFRRRLYMPGSQYGEHSYAKSNRHSRFGSVTSIDSYNDDQSPSYSDRRSKGYTFTSPWDGRCEFSTGVSGRSLKCKHYLPAQPGAGIEVSELRFNLPTTSSKAGKMPLTDNKRTSYLSGLHTRGLSSNSEDWSARDSVEFVFDEKGKLDLSLGQERAGGGFGGKQAKLGKLIIQPEGLGMLDLLVAANLGLWWRAWGR